MWQSPVDYWEIWECSWILPSMSWPTRPHFNRKCISLVWLLGLILLCVLELTFVDNFDVLCLYSLNVISYHCGHLKSCFPFQNVIDQKPYPDDDSLVEVKFATTPIMSTYLVAFVIGEYDFVESQSADGITVRVYTPIGKAEQGKFALEVSFSLCLLVKYQPELFWWLTSDIWLSLTSRSITVAHKI